MKKALVLLLALSMVFGAFAAEPVANVNVSEFKGEASVTWGVDLDAKETGFKNDAKVTLKLNLIDGGDKSSTGEGVWGEIKIKTDGDTFTKVEGNDKEFGALTIPAKIKVDTAKLRFGDNAYIGITSGDTIVGEYKLDTAIGAEKISNGNRGANNLSDDSEIDVDKGTFKLVYENPYTQGIVAGYANDMFSVDVDFRSDAAAQYTNRYAFAVDGSLKAVENLTFKAGYAQDFANSRDEDIGMGYYVATDYKLGLNDTFYLKPQAGFVNQTIKNDDASISRAKLVSAVLFGWGDKEDAKAGVYFLNDDDSKKVVPGISVAVDMPLWMKVEDGDDSVSFKEPLKLAVSFFSGKIVKNLTAAAYFETFVGEDQTTVKMGDVEVKSDAVKAEGYQFAAGLKYKLEAGEGTITPQFGIAMADKGYAKEQKQVIKYNNTPKYDADNTDKALLNIKAGAEFKGYVENTTFSVEYASKNLKNKDSTGTLNFTCKIAL